MIRQAIRNLASRAIVGWVKWQHPEMYQRVAEGRRRGPVIHSCDEMSTKYELPRGWHMRHRRSGPGYEVQVNSASGGLVYSGCGCPCCFDLWLEAL